MIRSASQISNFTDTPIVSNDAGTTVPAAFLTYISYDLQVEKSDSNLASVDYHKILPIVDQNSLQLREMEIYSSVVFTWNKFPCVCAYRASFLLARPRKRRLRTLEISFSVASPTTNFYHAVSTGDYQSEPCPSLVPLSTFILWLSSFLAHSFSFSLSCFLFARRARNADGPGPRL